MSDAVKLSYPEPRIAVVELRDEAARNAFTPGIWAGLVEAMDAVASEKRAHVVVAHGYGNYFCTGGTREMLARITSGEASFAESDFFQAFLHCPVPVIAAMQGHAVGGGFTLGCYADFMVLAREAIYHPNFMRLGFPPGAGSTLLFPWRFGRQLGSEMLMRGNGWRGSQIEARGVGIPVVPERDVVETALRMAYDIADAPMAAVKQLKAELTRELRAQLPAVIEREVQMHEACFADPEIRRRVQERFGV